MTQLRIDSHQHFWRYRAEDYPWIGACMDLLAQDKLPAELQPLLQAQKLDGSIAVQARAGREETRFLLELARTNPRIAGVVGWEDIAAPELAARMQEWEGTALLGLRHQLQDEEDVAAFLARDDFNRGMAWLQSEEYVYDVLVFESQLPATQTFCARHDQHWLVLDHLGKPALREFGKGSPAFARWREQLTALAQLPHVACKLSGLVTEADWKRGLRQSDFEHIRLCLDSALDAFGPQRLMFGSDWPVCLLAASYSRVASLVEEWAETRLSADEQAQLWGGTAARCYGIAN
ncbi:amidohydrolase family protein [Herbaspirillum lusitanum]|uniref:Amidohydrolase family protein n=1 Tax=Herbaspirillum lusitanum TaxID=213312 RepID=A0ABW9A7P3_9BURK